MAPTHRRTKVNRWKSAGALALLLVSISASGGAPAGISLADETGIPGVPSKPYDQPASVQPAVAITASPVTVVADVAANVMPATALLAYRRTETLLADSDPRCKLAWTLVAAIGRVESNHGRTGGNSLDADGVARPGIYGIPLDGSRNTTTIRDTDDGAFDNDELWDRAVGPMQFIPGTWTSVAIDSDNDGKSDPQNILDAAAAAGVYLCAGIDDLATEDGARKAVRRYNHSDSYVDKVLAIASQYASGTFTDQPTILFAAPPPVVENGATQNLPTNQMSTLGPSPTPAPTPTPSPTPAPSPTPTPSPTPAPSPTPTPSPTTSPTTNTPTSSATQSATPSALPTDPPVPEPFAGTEPEARERCLATGDFVAGSVELEQCVLTLMQTGYLPAPPATQPAP